MNIRTIILWITVAVILGYVGYGVVQKETLIADGEPLYLELGTRDPRSLIQGDYMVLNYRIAEEIAADELEEWPRRGQIVVERAADGVATFVRRYEEGEALASNERLLDYLNRGWRIEVGIDSFFFQEGTAEQYEEARYAEFRTDGRGGSVLVALRDEELTLLGTPLFSSRAR